MAWYDENQSNQQSQTGGQQPESGSPNPGTSTGWTNPTPENDPNAPYTAPVTHTPGASSSNYPNPYAWQHQPPTPPTAPQPPKKKKGMNVLVAVIAIVGVIAIGALAITLGRAFGGDGKTPVDDDRDQAQGNSWISIFGGDDKTSEDDDQTQENNPAATLEIAGADENAELLSVKSAIQANLNSTVNLVIYSQQVTGFGGFYGNYNNTESQLVQTGAATGIIMSEDGFIITNSHCVVNEETGAVYDRIDVELYDGTVYESAQVVGADADTDLAVIKINATGLTPATFGDSSTLELGDTVIVLGNAGGLGWTPSRGIISGSARDVYDSTGYGIKCLQTDAAINPGNSGGPLINLYGQVVGINSAKIVAEEYESLGFSIPINEAKGIIDDLIKNGYVTGRVSLGITGTTVKLLSYPGFQIASIAEESDLKNTKAQVGDIITHVNGERVEGYSELRAALVQHEVGDSVTLTLIRLSNYGVETVEVTCKLIANQG